MIFDVYVKGLGGPMSDFTNLSYQVEAENHGAAVEKAIVAANEDFDRMASYYNDKARARYNLYSVTVSKSTQVRRVI